MQPLACPILIYFRRLYTFLLLPKYPTYKFLLLADFLLEPCCDLCNNKNNAFFAGHVDLGGIAVTHTWTAMQKFVLIPTHHYSTTTHAVTAVYLFCCFWTVGFSLVQSQETSGTTPRHRF